MSRPAIVAENVSKTFRIYQTPADLAWEVLTGRSRHKDFVALDNVSFSMQPGQIVGIIGRNGAGKSTLLKIVAGTLEATSGTIEINGRVSAILELGTGFNPEYTGRDNIYLGGLCLGLTREEIRVREAQIIAFSELEEFIDQPFKTYSNGMQARLTFSVAVSVDPEILIIDEALSVGDAKFQRKCFQKIEEFRVRGCTILLVSHQANIVEGVCDRAIYLSAGRIIYDGSPREAVGKYLEDLFGAKEIDSTNATKSWAQTDTSLRYGTGEATIVDCGVLDDSGRATYVQESGSRYALFCDVHCNAEEIGDLNVGISITTTVGVVLVAANSVWHRSPIPRLLRGDTVRITLTVDLNLGPGNYFVTLGAWGTFAEKHYDRWIDAIQLRVRGDPQLGPSLVNMRPQYRVSRLRAKSHERA